MYVPGSDLWDTKDVPHGAIAEVTYRSASLGMFRRMHVYTPPGYENGVGRYPVLYLLHGGTENDDTWSSVGRAGLILDNLIAAKRAKPMIVVMPTGPPAASSGMGRSSQEQFVANINRDVMSYVERNYRVLTNRATTAIAGASIGGNHALTIAMPRLDRFAYVGVFSSGLIGAFRDLPGRGGAAGTGRGRRSADQPPLAREWEQLHASKLADPSLKKGLRLLWFATGTEDFILDSTRATLALLEKHGFTPTFREVSGGHTWRNWRLCLGEFLPQLFQANQRGR